MPDISYTSHSGETYSVRKTGKNSSSISKNAGKTKEVKTDAELRSIDAKNFRITINGKTKRREFWVHKTGGKRILSWPGGSMEIEAQEFSESNGAGTGKLQALKLKMPGKVLSVKVKEGDIVDPGQGLVVVEAMKMENLLLAAHKAKVSKVHIQVGDRLESGAILISFEALDI